ncbi:OmpA family protein [Aureibaculum sp. A20]|uniref:OmpA family protein n=1 Tax=Aureibaculum flavum TaxID=2795986 RepID=A0ABS0WN59_9FLAO|nr:OmpA family protein [Aureibaculum flavum]MBJ2173382.1 OmpA family protein [Aureibaculum flavum]
MKNKVILLITLCLSLLGYAQNKYIADQYFNDLAYKKSAELYEKIYKKGENKDYLVISRLADSYYANSEMEKAEVWYEKLVANFGKEVSKKHFLRYAQALRSNGNYKSSDAVFKEYFYDSPINTETSNEMLSENYLSLIASKNIKNHITIHNVAINTPYSDFGGFLHHNKFYFASTASKNKRKSKKYKWNNQPYLNLYEASVNDTLSSVATTNIAIDDLKNKEVFSKKINTKHHEASLVITKDGKTMYFTRSNYSKRRALNKKESIARLKIYKANLINGEWKNSKALPFNSNTYSVGHPALSADEKTLYFISDMAGGYGNTDLYKVAIKNKNKFGKPVNLGNKVNTTGREMFPYIGAKNMLYFSSDGYKGLGGLDIYETQIEENGNIGPVKNIKAPFNSNLDDFGFVVDANIQKGFFSSNRAGGKGDDDIYSFSIDKSSILEVKKAPEKPFPIARLKDSIRNSIPTKSVDKKENEILNKEEVKSLIVDNESIVNPIYFDFDSFNIKKDVESYLDNIVKILEENPTVAIKIESHTDSRGSEDYNKKLSEKRAKATRNYMLSKGIAVDRIKSVIGFGEEKLLYSCSDSNDQKCSEEIHQKNRRSYVYLLNTNGIEVNDNVQETIVNNDVMKASTDKLKDVVVDGDELSAVKNQIVTDPIYFNLNKYSIREDAKPELEKVIEVMKNNPEMVIKIESHTDSRGSKEYNKKLSDKRAKATRNYIISQGISRTRIQSAIGYGEDMLLNDCNDVNQTKCSKDEHQLNRRSYFYVVTNKQNRVSSSSNK